MNQGISARLGLAVGRRAATRPVLLGALGALLLWAIIVFLNHYARVWTSPHPPGDLLSPLWIGNPHLPYLAEAAARAARGILAAGLLLAAAVGLGKLLSRLAGWRYDTGVEGWTFATALGIGGLSYLGLLLAAVGLYRPFVLVVATLTTAVAAAGFLAPRPLKIRRKPARGHAWRLWPWPAITAIAVLSAFVAALAPELETDAIWFHLYFPRLFLESGRLVDLPTEYISLYPMTWELWYGYGLALGGQTAATLLHFACLPLIGALVFEMSRRWGGMSASQAWLAVAILCSVPLLMWEASTAYLDLAFTLHIALAAYALVRFVDRQRSQWLWLAAINLGLGLATKHLGLVCLAILAPGLFILLWLRDRSISRSARPVLLLGLVSLAIPFPWYLRSWLATGNPVFPELFGLFGPVEGRWDAMTNAGLQAFFDRFGRPRTIWNLLTLPWDMTIHAARYGGTFGPIFLMFLPALLLRRLRRELAYVAAFTLAYAIAWASPIASFQVRWLMPIAPFLAVLTAAAWLRLTALTRKVLGRRAAVLASLALAGLLILNLPPFTPMHEHDRSRWEGWLTHTLHGVPLGIVLGGESKESYLRRNIPSYAAWQVANRELPLDARVLTLSGDIHFYSRRSRVSALSTAARPALRAAPGDELGALRVLRALGISHIMIEDRYLRANRFPDDTTWEDLALTRSATRSQWYELVFADDRTALYRIRWERLRPGQP
jgi:hypothetical protein